MFLNEPDSLLSGLMTRAQFSHRDHRETENNCIPLRSLCSLWQKITAPFLLLGFEYAIATAHDRSGTGLDGIVSFPSLTFSKPLHKGPSSADHDVPAALLYAATSLPWPILFPML